MSQNFTQLTVTWEYYLFAAFEKFQTSRFTIITIKSFYISLAAVFPGITLDECSFAELERCSMPSEDDIQNSRLPKEILERQKPCLRRIKSRSEQQIQTQPLTDLSSPL